MKTVWDTNASLFDDYIALFTKLGIGEFDHALLNRFDQIHAGGIQATEKLAVKAGVRQGTRILELGGGIGGVARFLSARYGISAVNLDLSWSYSITGSKLSGLLTPLDVQYINADGLFCPFKDGSFDCVWLQHVNMNIADKTGFLHEIRRVLKDNGSAIFHEWFLTGTDAEISFPLPWSDDRRYSHLVSSDDFLNLAAKQGFRVDFCDDESELSLKFYRKLLESKAFKNPIFKGRDAQRIFENAAAMLEKGILRVVSGKLSLKNKS